MKFTDAQQVFEALVDGRLTINNLYVRLHRAKSPHEKTMYREGFKMYKIINHIKQI